MEICFLHLKLTECGCIIHSEAKNEIGTDMKKYILDYSFIVIGSILYMVGTVFFIFPSKILLGGTTGISVMLERWLPFSPGMILMTIEIFLLVIAFIFLGRELGIKTTVGSILSAVTISGGEWLFPLSSPPIENPYLSAAVGSAVIAVASGFMFFVDSNSGGTDIIAMIVKKYAKINIGIALLITDVLIVIVGAILSGREIGIASATGFLIKVFGIDGVIYLIRKIKLLHNDKSKTETEENVN